MFNLNNEGYASLQLTGHKERYVIVPWPVSLFLLIEYGHESVDLLNYKDQFRSNSEMYQEG